jgi:hypothetical protein
MNLRVPGFPGEDFLTNLPCGQTTPYSFADINNYNLGTGDIFITLEPDNYSGNSNFPVLLFATANTTNDESVLSTIPAYNQISDTTANHEQGFLLQNIGGAVKDNPFGLPRIRVEMVRE